MTRGRTVIVLLGSFIVGAVFIAAGAMKALDVNGFSRDIALHGIVGPGLAAVLARVLIPFEIVAGAAVIIGYRRRLGLALLIGSLILFIGVTGWAWAHGNTEGCGCFGRFASRTPLTVILEDVVLLVLAAAAWIAARPPASEASAGVPSATGILENDPGALPPRESASPVPRLDSGSVGSPGTPLSSRAGARRWRPLLIAGLAVAATAMTLASPYLPIDDYATALRPGVSLHELGLDSIAGDLAEGDRLLVILDIDQEATIQAVPTLNALMGHSGVPRVTGLTSADEKKRAEFFWTAAPSFEIIEVPSADLRRMYRRAPRSFRVHNGAVLQVWEGIPPVEDLAP